MIVLAVMLLTTVACGQDDGEPTAREPVPRDGDARIAIGLWQLQRRLGSKMPTGEGIVLGHVEGNQGDYLPAINTPPFNGVEFVIRSGPSVINGHAQSTARIIYGRTGLAPGIRKVNLYSSYHWLRGGYLRTSSPINLESDDRQQLYSDSDWRQRLMPVEDDTRVFTHSWVGGGDDLFTRQALRRIDWVIENRDVIMVAGVNNGHATHVPALVCSAYNTIAVGNWVGDSSGRYTIFDGPGRCKPDLVGPNNQTSYATPTTAAMVTRLLETADKLGDPRAPKPQVIKAVLMAGAEKPPGWRVEAGKPLDDHFGAGRLRVDHAYDILTAPPAQPGVVRSRYAWDFRALEPRESVAYRLETPAALGECSIIITWHRRIDGRVLDDLLNNQTRWVETSRMADFDLRLIQIDDAGNESVLHESVSRIDNVEHVYLPSLRAGRYRIEVVRLDALDEPWDVAIAWRIEEPAK